MMKKKQRSSELWFPAETMEGGGFINEMKKEKTNDLRLFLDY